MKKVVQKIWTGRTWEKLLSEVVVGTHKSAVFDSYQEMIRIVNTASKGEYVLGQNVYIVDVGVPDLWISEILDTPKEYEYTSDEDIVNLLNDVGYLPVGHFMLSALEVKSNLKDYVKFTDLVDNVSEKPGLVKIKYGGQSGFEVDSTTGFLGVNPPGTNNMKQRDNVKPLVSAQIENIMWLGVTGFKETWNGQAMVSSYGNQRRLTDKEKGYAREWLGAVGLSDAATSTKLGLVKPRYGFSVSTDGTINIAAASKDDITSKYNSHNPITPSNMDYAWKISATTNSETWLSSEKAAACNKIGALYAQGAFFETWDFILEDGTQVSKKILIRPV